jgi:hypothetical protein
MRMDEPDRPAIDSSQGSHEDRRDIPPVFSFAAQARIPEIIKEPALASLALQAL